jgi:starch synthase
LILRILQIASEAHPLIKTGGLADVVGTLPGALAEEGVEIRTLLPGYPAVMAAISASPQIAHVLPDLPGGPARLIEAQARGLDLLVLDAPPLFARAGGPYADLDGQDWPDNPLRFAALSAAAARIAQGALPGWLPHILHAHDWQAALVPAYLHYWNIRLPSVLTIHNLAFPGKFAPALLPDLFLPPESMGLEALEFFGAASALKGGLVFASAITTVSPSYAEEILTEAFGMGLDGVLHARRAALIGILNGIDITAWNPATDAALTARFDATTLPARAANKSALQRGFGLPESDAPLFGVVSRLSWQKGVDLLLDSLPALSESGAQLVVLGAGDRDLEDRLRQAAAADPARIACHIGYDEALAHRLQAGVDALLVPSRFEPCGLTQLCALRYGTIPVVSRVGGLADTIIDANAMAVDAGVATGVQFSPVTPDALAGAIRRCVALYHSKHWRQMQASAMRTDVSWRAPAGHYAALYRRLMAA